MDGWKDIVGKHKKTVSVLLMIFNIKQRCLILCLAYMFALEEMSWAQ
jgi:hypothetical protein